MHEHSSQRLQVMPYILDTSTGAVVLGTSGRPKPSTSRSDADKRLKMTAKRYTLDGSERNVHGLTLLFAHCIGAHKEQWEPTIERIFHTQLNRHKNGIKKSKYYQIREAWAFDWQNHGDAGVLNRELLKDRPEGVSVYEWASAIAAFVKSLYLKGHRIVPMGHSAGAGAVFHLHFFFVSYVTELRMLSTKSFPIPITQHFYQSQIPYVSLVLIEATMVTRDLFFKHFDDRMATMEFTVEATAIRRDTWPGREEAFKWLSKRFPWNGWDERVVRILADYGLQEAPSSSSSDSGQNQVVTLKCDKKQEAISYPDVDPHFEAVAELERVCRVLPDLAKSVLSTRGLMRLFQQHPSPPPSPPSPPSPPPKDSRVRSRARSFSKKSLSNLRGSHSNTHLNSSRPSLPISNNSSQSQLMLSISSSTSQNSHSPSSPKREVRKTKSSFFPKQLSSILPGRRSKSRLRAEPDDIEHPSLRPKTPPLPDRYISSSERGHGRRTKHSYPRGSLSQPHSPTFNDDYVILDTNIEEMDGIVSSTVLSSTTASGSTSPTSASASAFDSSSYSQSLSDKMSLSSYPTPQSFLSSYEFHNPNPFSTTPGPRLFSPEAAKRIAAMADAQISPKTIIPRSQRIPQITIPRLPDGHNHEHHSDSPTKASWTAPESWKVAPEVPEVETPGEEGGSSAEEDFFSRSSKGSKWSLLNDVVMDQGIPEVPDTFSLDGSEAGHGRGSVVGGLERLREGEQRPSTTAAFSGIGSTLMNGVVPRKGSDSRSVSTRSSSTAADSYLGLQSALRRPQRSVPQLKEFQLKIFRADKRSHTVRIGFQITVKSLTEALSSKSAVQDNLKDHNLFLVENGRERILGPSERPLDIVRRRLEMAGFDMREGRDVLGIDGLSFLLKFVYKDQALGPTPLDLGDNFELVDLDNRGLRTIPIVLHQKADQIYALRLSGNPMLNIPLDFIQSCTSLGELHMCNMALKRVPHNVQYCAPLTRLDVSNNRIADLTESYLEKITGLQTLLIQNNRLDDLPWHFPRLRSLKKLNLSNNRFKDLPVVLCKLENLRDLDISFNMLTSLPRDIGRMVNLERLVMVGNDVTSLPNECAEMVNLQSLDCRWNLIKDLGGITLLPNLEVLNAEHNALQEFALFGGPKLQHVHVSHNEISRVTFVPGPVARPPYCLITLDISHNKLSTIDDSAIAQLPLLRTLRLDHNTFKFLPEAIGSFKWLETLSCSYNGLESIPPFIGKLQKLETLEIHNNCLTDLPITLWNCESLRTLNATSNSISAWQYPPIPSPAHSIAIASGDPLSSSASLRKGSTTSQMSSSSNNVHPCHPPLTLSLEKLYLGENRIHDDLLSYLMLLREMKVLNLSFNDITELPSTFFRSFHRLEELYLSGNKIQTIPTEDLPKLTHLSILYLNGNKIQHLPQELAKVRSLTVLDVGSNVLNYNINNWEYDWNWNFNKNLRYLNLSGNKKLQIKNDGTGPDGRRQSHSFDLPGDPEDPLTLAGFTALKQLRVLGLMDVTIMTTVKSVDIPDENADRRVRSSESTVLGMAYGIADSLGKNNYLNMLDLVHAFPERPGEAVFAMFGRSVPGKTYHFLDSPELKGRVPEALRRSFLKVNHDLHNFLFGRKATETETETETDTKIVQRGGASGVVVYIAGKKLFVANVGDALAVISRGGVAHSLSKKHDPYSEGELRRIRAAEGWVSQQSGLINDEADVSKSFGFFHLPYLVNARPDVFEWDLSALDEFVIVGTPSLWKFVSFQTAVEIARREDYPMIAAQKLRDIALSYGACGTTMIMVISVADLFNQTDESRTPKTSLLDANVFKSLPRVPRDPRDQFGSEVPAPIGHLALVFTDIRNSTHLWDVNDGMKTAWRLHNNLLRKLLRLCGGYEVKTEGDAFMCAFPTSLEAVWWCLSVQEELLKEPWPMNLLQCDDGRPIYEPGGRLVTQGLAVRMGIHCGTPLCERDPVNHRMDYFGPMVNRAARVNGIALGGQIMCSADVMREIRAKVFGDGPSTPYSDHQTQQAINSIRQIGVAHFLVGEVKLKGLELPEMVTVIYPKALAYRHQIQDYLAAPADWFSCWAKPQVSEIRQLGTICLRLEALASQRIFRDTGDRKASVQSRERQPSVHNLAPTPSDDQTATPPDEEQEQEQEPEEELYLYGDSNLLLPTLTDKSSDRDMTMVLDMLVGRIANAASRLVERTQTLDMKDSLATVLLERGELDERTLQSILGILQDLNFPPPRARPPSAS
ncbi:hypothetical protein D9758_012998 [Tetrapyrgos nigripes]|uniref:Adenylate cyclase n=1 Tax=Tetrapyrgos nigripes TaxID=182062 RepID=A0A8H5C9K5_9AGAR|nr:hypothetical protein D9758_012998 [Tetrapyrgos nigripes]